MGRLSGKVAIVTGGASGIGEGIARRFALEGAKVAIGDLSDADGERIAQEIGGGCLYRHTDVSRSTHVKQLVDAAVAKFGRLDILVNNAAILHQGKTIVDTAEEDFDRIYEVNLKGAWLGMKHAIPAIAKSGRGSIVNIASIAAVMGNAGQSGYGATKGGVVQLTRQCAAEVAAQKIRVNSISPGTIVTAMSRRERPHMTIEQIREASAKRNPLGHIPGPDDIAYCAVWLASDEAAYVTGQNIVIDGGMTSIRRTALDSK